MKTNEFYPEPGWYFARFRSGDDPDDPDSWEPWFCVEVFHGGEHDGYEHDGYEDGFYGVDKRKHYFWNLPDADRYEWGSWIRTPDWPLEPGPWQYKGCTADGWGSCGFEPETGALCGMSFRLTRARLKDECTAQEAHG